MSSSSATTTFDINEYTGKAEMLHRALERKGIYNRLPDISFGHFGPPAEVPVTKPSRAWYIDDDGNEIAIPVNEFGGGSGPKLSPRRSLCEESVCQDLHTETSADHESQPSKPSPEIFLETEVRTASHVDHHQAS